MGIANTLTFIRIFISPVFLVVYMKHSWLGISPTLLPYVLLTLLTVLELSDLVDGYVARTLNQVTDLGKILDPMADSIARISVLLTFTTGVIQLPMLLVFVFLYRDSVTSSLRTACALRGFALAARPSGKIKAVIQAVAAYVILLAMIPHSLGHLSTESLQMIAVTSVGTAAVYSLYAVTDYLIANAPYIEKILTTRSDFVVNE